MDGIVALLLSKKFTKDTVIGMGAIKGAACQVQSINKVNKTTTITLEWEDNLGTSHTQSFDIEDGLDGVSVTGATIKPDGHLELTLSNGNSIDCGQVLPQYDTMPTPSASNEGQILQYIGTTTSSYTNGYFYECINDGGTYKWVEKLVQDSYTKIEIGDLSNLPDNTKNVVQNIVDINDKIDDKENIFRYNVIPTASVDISGVIIQYLGATNATYTNGYYYQCVELPVGSGTYVWVQKNVQPNNGGGGGDGVVDGYYNSADQLFYEDSAFLNPIAGEDNTIYIDLNTNGLYRYDGTIFIKVSSSAESIQVTTLPTADVTQLDKIYQYIGTTDANYTNGYFYRCIYDSIGNIYSWEQINVQPHITVDSTLSSTSENPVQNKVIYTALDDKVDKVTGKGLSENDYTDADKTIVDNVTTALAGKADLAIPSSANNFATLNASGNLSDSGINKDIVPSSATSSNKLSTHNDLPTELNDLSDDVVITNPQPSQILAYNGTSGKWENKTGQETIGGLVFKGSILFANLPTTGMSNGDAYDIKDAFVTDNRFEEGSGIACGAGTDIVWAADENKWNILTPSGVYSFNGRTGAVAPATSDYDADQIDYNNTTSGLTATNVQNSIDELSSEKADKVTSATNGHLAGLDSNGNLTDSGVVANDVIQKVATATGLLKDDGTVDTTEYQPIELSTPITTLSGSQLTVETALGGINDDVVKTFTGTQAQWDALSLADKQKYEICNITDDGSTDNVYTVGEVDVLLDEKLSYADNGILGAKNLLKNNAISQTINGVTFTVNADGSVKVNGTATGDTTIRLVDTRNQNKSLYKGQRIILSKGLNAMVANTNIWFNCYNGNTFLRTLGSAQGILTSESDPFTVDYSDYDGISIGITISNGITVSNIIFYPMLRLATDTDSTYQPYVETNYTLTQNKMSYVDNGILGAKNLLEVMSNTQTISGVTFTVNTDKSITVNGTATANVSYVLKRNIPLTAGNTYIISRGIAGDNDFQFVATAWNSGTYVKNIVEVGAGDYTEKSFTPDYNGYNDVQISIFVRSGTTLSNAMVYPMIRLASDSDDTYVSYAMTNKELTDKVIPKSISNIDLDTIIENGEYFCLGNLTNKPSTAGNFGLLKVVRLTPTTNTYRQIYYEESAADAIYSRSHLSTTGNWTSWYKFTGTVV